MTLPTGRIKQLQEEAQELGVALVLPIYLHWIDPQSQNHELYKASMELNRLRHERGKP